MIDENQWLEKKCFIPADKCAACRTHIYSPSSKKKGIGKKKKKQEKLLQMKPTNLSGRSSSSIIKSKYIHFSSPNSSAPGLSCPTPSTRQAPSSFMWFMVAFYRTRRSRWGEKKVCPRFLFWLRGESGKTSLKGSVFADEGVCSHAYTCIHENTRSELI